MSQGDFSCRSNGCLNRLVDHIGGLDSRADVRKFNDVYQHLLKAQRAALESGCDAAMVDRFDREWAVCETCLGGGAPPPSGESPSEEQLEEFRRKVSAWFQLDDEERAARRRGAERRLLKSGLTGAIQAFMQRFGIEDLETREGTLRTYEKEVRPVPNRAVQLQRIGEFFAGREADLEVFKCKVFEPSPATVRSGIRRLNPR